MLRLTHIDGVLGTMLDPDQGGAVGRGSTRALECTHHEINSTIDLDEFN